MMTIEELDTKLEELNTKLEEFSKLVAQFKEEPQSIANSVRWRASKHCQYYRVSSRGSILAVAEEFTDEDEFNYNIGNYFMTETQAQEYRAYLELHRQLLDFLEYLNTTASSKETIFFLCLDSFGNASVRSAKATDASVKTQAYKCFNPNVLAEVKKEFTEQNLLDLLQRGF